MTNQIIKELTLTRVFDAPREIVFNAWIEPGIVAQWFSPTGFTNPKVELDPRPGGRMLIHMQAPDGTVMPMKGTFDVVEPPERLVFTSGAVEDAQGNFALEDRTTVTFDDLGGKTRVTMHAEVIKASPEAREALSGMEEGWNQTLDKLEAVLKARAV